MSSTCLSLKRRVNDGESRGLPSTSLRDPDTSLGFEWPLTRYLLADAVTRATPELSGEHIHSSNASSGSDFHVARCPRHQMQIRYFRDQDAALRYLTRSVRCSRLEFCS